VQRLPELVVAVAALVVTAGSLVASPPEDAGQWVGGLGMVLGSVLLAGWRLRPLTVLVVGPALLLPMLWLGPDPATVVLIVLMGYAALLAERFGGRGAWLSGAAFVGYLALLYVGSGDDSIGLAMLTVPGFLAGTALRLRRETAEDLAERGRELERERELFAELSVRNERARIASELHDIVGHALSVMVVQAAAGQRLVDRAPDAASASLEVIADSARQGRADLQRLVDLLAGTTVASPDLSLVEEVVARAARSGLQVTCRLEGDHDGLDAAASHAAYRVVQEGLTNALRHAPGAEVLVVVRGEGRAVQVQVRSGAALELPSQPWAGGGRGLSGLRELVLALGGTFAAGPCADGGWLVEAGVSS
jgi:signal transduction histidine kinase